MWDATQYLRFGGERSRPFFDLLARVGAELPEHVVDMGCGPGNLTVLLAERWPSAAVCGVDSSPQMIEAARKLISAHAPQPAGSGPVLTNHAPGLSFVVDDVRHWEPQSLPDVIISNAVLQWVPGHRELLVRWADWLTDDGWLAFQVPGNFDQPSHAILRELVASARWRPLLRDVELNRQSADPADYAELLAGAGCEVDAWETTYVHILEGEDPVLEWYKGTGLRPVLAVLGADQAADFLADYGERVRAAYPPRSFGTVFPFRRVFTVAHRAKLPGFSYRLNRKALAGSRHAPWPAPPISALPSARSRRRRSAGASPPAVSGRLALTARFVLPSWLGWSNQLARSSGRPGSQRARSHSSASSHWPSRGQSPRREERSENEHDDPADVTRRRSWPDSRRAAASRRGAARGSEPGGMAHAGQA